MSTSGNGCAGLCVRLASSAAPDVWPCEWHASDPMADPQPAASPSGQGWEVSVEMAEARECRADAVTRAGDRVVRLCVEPIPTSDTTRTDFVVHLTGSVARSLAVALSVAADYVERLDRP